MHVLVTGATGLIGSTVAAGLLRGGHSVTGLARDAAGAARRFPALVWRGGDFRALSRPEDWRPLLDGIEAVVNCAGALQDNARDSLAAVHVTGADALFAACAEAGIARFVQISAVGAAADAPGAFMRTKGEGDALLLERIPNAVILRPALVIADGAYGGTALLRGLAAFPLITPVPVRSGMMKTVDAQDVAATVAAVLDGKGRPGATYELAHPDALSLPDILALYRGWLGLGLARPLRLPNALCRLACRIGDALGPLGWRAPMRSNAMAQLEGGIGGDGGAWTADFGIAPRSLADRFARMPATIQDRWHARLFLLKPVLIALLAALWIGTAIVSLGPGEPRAVDLLTGAGLPAPLAIAANLGLSLLDLALGIAVLFARLVRPAALLMALLSLFYALSITALAPALWVDPLGAALKIAAVFGLALAVAALAEER